MVAINCFQLIILKLIREVKDSYQFKTQQNDGNKMHTIKIGAGNSFGNKETLKTRQKLCKNCE